LVHDHYTFGNVKKMFRRNVFPVSLDGIHLIWRVFDFVNYSKTSHVLAVASFWLRVLIKNSSCAWSGELLIAWDDRKLVMFLIGRVFDYVSW
jgi:hypothetical protein